MQIPLRATTVEVHAVRISRNDIELVISKLRLKNDSFCH